MQCEQCLRQFRREGDKKSHKCLSERWKPTQCNPVPYIQEIVSQPWERVVHNFSVTYDMRLTLQVQSTTVLLHSARPLPLWVGMWSYNISRNEGRKAGVCIVYCVCARAHAGHL